jgi:hypothetical protein
MGIRIECDVHNENKRIHYVDEYLKVWPCCYFSQMYKPGRPIEDIHLRDDLFSEKNKTDPEWNDLRKRSFKEIINEHLLKDYTYYEGWENNPSPVCIENCSTDD